jgi:hypothetical protein
MQSEQRMSNLIMQSEQRMSKLIMEGFKSLHNFERDRVDVLKDVSYKFGSITIEGKEICSNFSATSHTVYLYSKLAMVTVPHFNCSVIPRGIVIDGKRDIALVAGCPKSNSALDISKYTKPALGDNVISFGYGKFAQVWTGVVAANLVPGTNETIPSFNPFSGENLTYDPTGEYLVTGDRHRGQSGGPTANGCGYLGMAHATYLSDRWLNPWLYTFHNNITQKVIIIVP